MKKRKKICTIVVFFGFIICVFFVFVFYNKYVNKFIQVVNIPESIYEILPESPRELKGDFAPIKQHDTESPILKQCFFYSGKTEDIYFILRIRFFSRNCFRMGLLYCSKKSYNEGWENRGKQFYRQKKDEIGGFN